MDISNRLGVVVTKELGKYLGVPIIHGRVTRKSHGYIVDRMKEKVQVWHPRNLSMAGRITLSQ